MLYLAICAELGAEQFAFEIMLAELAKVAQHYPPSDRLVDFLAAKHDELVQVHEQHVADITRASWN